jgi:hypothetical protein
MSGDRSASGAGRADHTSRSASHTAILSANLAHPVADIVHIPCQRDPCCRRAGTTEGSRWR